MPTRSSWWPIERPNDPSLSGARLIVVGDEPVLTDGLVQALRAHECLVGVTDSRARGLARLAFLDAHAVLFDPCTIVEARLRRALDRERRLRGARLIPFLWEEVWPSDAQGPNLEPLRPAIDEALRPDREIRHRVRTHARTPVPFEAIGPARVLRALSGATDAVLRLIVSSEHTRAVVELAGDLVVSAALFDVAKDEHLVGAPALHALLDERQGCAHVERHELAASMTVMAPMGLALATSFDASAYEDAITAARELDRLNALRELAEAERRAHLARLELARRGGDPAPMADDDPWGLEHTTAKQPMDSLMATVERHLEMEIDVTVEAQAYRPDELMYEADPRSVRPPREAALDRARRASGPTDSTDPTHSSRPMPVVLGDDDPALHDPALHHAALHDPALHDPALHDVPARAGGALRGLPASAPEHGDGSELPELHDDSNSDAITLPRSDRAPRRVSAPWAAPLPRAAGVGPRVPPAAPDDRPRAASTASNVAERATTSTHTASAVSAHAASAASAHAASAASAHAASAHAASVHGAEHAASAYAAAAHAVPSPPTATARERAPEPAPDDLLPRATRHRSGRRPRRPSPPPTLASDRRSSPPSIPPTPPAPSSEVDHVPSAAPPPGERTHSLPPHAPSAELPGPRDPVRPPNPPSPHRAPPPGRVAPAAAPPPKPRSAPPQVSVPGRSAHAVEARRADAIPGGVGTSSVDPGSVGAAGVAAGGVAAAGVAAGGVGAAGVAAGGVGAAGVAAAGVNTAEDASEPREDTMRVRVVARRSRVRAVLLSLVFVAVAAAAFFWRSHVLRELAATNEPSAWASSAMTSHDRPGGAHPTTPREHGGADETRPLDRASSATTSRDEGTSGAVARRDTDEALDPSAIGEAAATSSAPEEDDPATATEPTTTTTAAAEPTTTAAAAAEPTTTAAAAEPTAAAEPPVQAERADATPEAEDGATTTADDPGAASDPRATPAPAGFLPDDLPYGRDRARSDVILARARAAEDDARHQLLWEAASAHNHNPHVAARIARDALEAGELERAEAWARLAVAVRRRRPEYRRLLDRILSAQRP